MSEILTSVDLTHKPGEAYHFLYASKLYETLFAVYGKFNYQMDSENKPEKLTIVTIDLKLINYNGNINIGFSKTIKDGKIFNNLYRHQDPLFLSEDAIYFEVQGMSSIMETTVMLDKPIVINKGKNHNIIFNRILIPINNDRFDPDKNDYSLKNITGKTYNEKEVVFDSEFRYRNGQKYFDKKPQEGMYGNPRALDLLKVHEQEQIKPLIASPRCHQSNVYLVHK